MVVVPITGVTGNISRVLWCIVLMSEQRRQVNFSTLKVRDRCGKYLSSGLYQGHSNLLKNKQTNKNPPTESIKLYLKLKRPEQSELPISEKNGKDG